MSVSLFIFSFVLRFFINLFSFGSPVSTACYTLTPLIIYRHSFVLRHRPFDIVNENCVPFCVMGPEVCLNKVVWGESRATVFSPLSLYHLREGLRNFSTSDWNLISYGGLSHSLKTNSLQFFFLEIHCYHFQISHVMYLYPSQGEFVVYPEKQCTLMWVIFPNPYP